MQKNQKSKKLYVISGSSGVGKGTVLKGFLEKNRPYRLSVSCTTRAMREGEIEGVNYFFVSREEFQKNIDECNFLEWAEFSGNLYGTLQEYVLRKLSEGKDLILEIDTQGALQVKKKMPEAVLIFIEPPSYEDLETRLRNRNTESEEAIQKRLQVVKLEMENAKSFDYRIVNDKVESAIQRLEEIIKEDS